VLSDLLNQLHKVREGLGRVGECWPQGPLSTDTGQSASIEAYLEQIRILEKVFSLDRADISHQLRRLHYSKYDCRPEHHRRGLRLDALFTGKTGYPLTWSADVDALSAQTLDTLYKTTHFILPSGILGSTNIGVLFAAIEAELCGASELGLVLENFTGVPFQGAVTWVGDLSVWFLMWNQSRINAEHNKTAWNSELVLNEMQKAFCPLELMLGNIDGQIIARHLGENLYESFDLLPSLADTIHRYFLESTSSEPNITVSNRFTHFLSAAFPEIPHDGNHISKDRAVERVTHFIERVSIFLLFHASRDSRFGYAVGFPLEGIGSNRLDEIASTVSEQISTITVIAERFVDFIIMGLLGTAENTSWPRQTNLFTISN
jgi:hypothetical protein